MKAFGKGKVYPFYSSPHVQTITLKSTEKLNEGTFMLNFTLFGVTDVSLPIRHNSTASDMLNALSAMRNMQQVSVSLSSVMEGSEGHQVAWTVTFLDLWQEPSLLSPIWFPYGCNISSCTPFDSSSPIPEQQIVTTISSDVGPFLPQAPLRYGK